MKVEVLFPEVCSLYGELGNIRYLQQSCPELEVIETDIKSRPAFLDQDVALVYMGSATEEGLALAAEALRPYRAELESAIEAGQRFLVTGNALDIFGRSVTGDDGFSLEGLGLFDMEVRYQMLKRTSSFFLGSFEGMDIVGFKSLFGYCYEAGLEEPFLRCIRGEGREPGAPVEGFCRKNFMATHLIGPLLVLNPSFTRYLLQQMGAENIRLAFEEEAMVAYEKRLAEFRDERINFHF
ncbi:MAG: hypothetical protein E7457_05755 [Ruminococcaceae bacterium]|nr:hypothetical protein [Oscillospiraceae bacterium]